MESGPSQILRYLYLGGRSDAKDKATLRRLGIKFILNVTPTRSQDPAAGVPNFFEKERLFTYKRISIFDNRGEDILGHMETAFNFIEQELTSAEALAHVKGCRPIVSPNAAFVAQLKRYDEILIVQREKLRERSGGAPLLAAVEAAGAIGPIGPARPPAQIGPSLPPSARGADDAKPAIGPSMPPLAGTTATSIGPALPPPPSAAAAVSKVIGPESPPAIAGAASVSDTIGPSLPPHLIPHAEEKVVVSLSQGEADGPILESNAAAGDRNEIGPTWPPSATTKQENEEHKGEVVFPAVIGPRVPNHSLKRAHEAAAESSPHASAAVVSGTTAEAAFSEKKLRT